MCQYTAVCTHDIDIHTIVPAGYIMLYVVRCTLTAYSRTSYSHTCVQQYTMHKRYPARVLCTRVKFQEFQLKLLFLLQTSGLSLRAVHASYVLYSIHVLLPTTTTTTVHIRLHVIIRVHVISMNVL